jgi:predicted dehydrogenase
MSAKFRYATDVHTALQLIQKSAIGSIRHVSLVFSSGLDVAGQWRSNKAFSGGGVLMDRGPQAFDLFHLFLGPLQCVRVEDLTKGSDYSVEDYVNLRVKSRLGIIGTCELSWRPGSEKDIYASIVGTEGEIELGWESARYRTVHNGDWLTLGEGYNQNQAFGAQLSNFLGAIRGSERLLTTLSDACASMAAIDAAYNSMESKDWQQIPSLNVY